MFFGMPDQSRRDWGEVDSGSQGQDPGMRSRSAMPLRCAAISGTTWSWAFLAWKSAIGDSGIIGFEPNDHQLGKPDDLDKRQSTHPARHEQRIDDPIYLDPPFSPSS